MLGTIKNAAHSLLESAQGALTAGLDKVKTTLEEFTAASPELEEIGYRVCATELCCALVPYVTVFLVRQRAPTEEGFDALLARRSSNTVRTVVALLRQTEKVIATFDLRDQKCSNIALELGIPPRVRLVYTDKDRPATCEDFVI